MFRQLVRALCILAVSGQLSAQELSKYTQEALDKELASASTARLAVKVPMRDGVSLATDIYLPNTANHLIRSFCGELRTMNTGYAA